MEMNELDFSGKQVLVVGGSSGIGNGIAQAFRAQGRAGRGLRHARGGVATIRRTKARISKASTISGSTSATPARSRNSTRPSSRLDVLVLAQGAVIYRRGEFEMKGFRNVLEVNLMSLMACATQVSSDAAAGEGLADHRELDRGLSFDHGQSRLQCVEDRRGRV